MKRALLAVVLAGLAHGTTSAEPFDLAARKARLPWIWQVPQPSPVPDAPGSGEIDRFLSAGLAARQLQAAPPADDATWLRRAHFMLVGLPPTPAEVDAFFADAPEHRRERRVDALLASPHFGERWARHWMDLVRYAESRGHEEDFAIANAWRYRDWLVRAFNADVPYDRFVREHVAGDLIAPRRGPAGENESILATGWAFLGEEVHNPVDIRQDECERIDNKVDVLSKTFLGLTVGCARCHDHKFDAISQQDYYALCGFVLGSTYRQARFETMEDERVTAEKLAAARAARTQAVGAALSAALKPVVARVSADLAAVRRALAGEAPGDGGARVDAWIAELKTAAGAPDHALHGVATWMLQPQSPVVAAAPLPAEAEIIADWREAGATPWRTDGPAFGTAPSPAGSLIFDAAGRPAGVTVVGAARRDPFWNRLDLAPGTELDPGLLGSALRAGKTLFTPKFTLRSGRVHILMRGKATFYAGVDSHTMLTGGLHNALRAGFDTGAQWKWVTHDLSGYAGHRAHFEFAPEGEAPLELALVVEAPVAPVALPFSPWIAPADAPDAAAACSALQADLAAAAEALATPDRLRGALVPLADWLVRHRGWLGADESAVSVAAADLVAETAALAAGVRWQSATAVAWADLTGTDESVLKRGKPTTPGPLAARGLPAAFGLPRIADTASSGRAALAGQIASADNPLVARVLVNRVWHHVFGRGLVATVDNFGWLGERPSNPALLDHLAWTFVHADGWSVKRLLRRLALTDAFARSSLQPHEATAEADPDNVFLHRMPVRRLEAEAVRDSLLVVSGAFDPALGGPPVPVHLTDFIVGRGRPAQSGPLDGARRRSLYTAVRRNFLPSLLTAFDYPVPFSTVGRRNVTNVPAQALVLTNDPFVHGQSAAWAGRLLREMPAASDRARITQLVQTAWARPATPAEVEAALETLAELRSLQPDEPEAAVWAGLCHALFASSEFTHVK